MKKIIAMFFLMACVSSNAAADNPPQELQFTASIGVGFQYAGVIGAQFGINNQKHKLYGAVGLVGLAAGYNYAVNDHIAIGLKAFTIPLAEGYGVNANYYFGSTFSKGWMAGIDVINSTSIFGSGDETAALISFGYTF